MKNPLSDSSRESRVRLVTLVSLVGILLACPVRTNGSLEVSGFPKEIVGLAGRPASQVKTFTLKNVASVAANWTNYFTCYCGSGPCTPDGFSLSPRSGTLAPNASTTITLTFDESVATAEPGVNYNYQVDSKEVYGACVDFRITVDPSAKLEYSPPALNFTAPANGAGSWNNYITEQTLTVKNVGFGTPGGKVNVNIEIDQNARDWLYFASGYLSWVGLDSNTESQFKLRLNYPNKPAGVYQTSVTIQNVLGIDYATNLPITVPITLTVGDTKSVKVTDINPSVAPNSQVDGFFKEPLTVTITGENFVQGCQVSLGAGIVAGAVRFKSATQLEADLTGFNNLLEGPRDVTVTNPDGTKGDGKELFYVSSLVLKAIEVNQGVPMDCTAARPGVANHNTIVRVRIECNGTSCETGKDQLRGWLHVFKEGRPISGSPFIPEVPLRVRPAGSPFNLQTMTRAQDTLNFVFNNENSIQDGGTYEFVFEVDPRQPNTYPSRGDSPNPKTSLIRHLANQVFQRSQTDKSIRLAVLVDGNQPADIAEAMGYFDFIRATYPISRNLLTADPCSANITFTTEAATISALSTWHNQQATSSGNPFTHILFFTRSLGFTDGGLSDCGVKDYWITTGAFYCRSHVMILGFRGNNTRGTVAHEVGHNFLLGDTYAGGTDNPKVNPCNSPDCQAAGNGSIVENGCMDTILRTVSVVVPSNPGFLGSTKRDFMGNPNRETRWTDLRTWNYLYTLLGPSAQSGGSPDLAAQSIQSQALDWIIVSGILTTNATGTFSSILRTSRADPGLVLPPGNFAIELQDQQGQRLAVKTFQPVFTFTRDQPRVEPQVPFSLSPFHCGRHAHRLEKG
jgi:hypothetical protein